SVQGQRNLDAALVARGAVIRVAEVAIRTVPKAEAHSFRSMVRDRIRQDSSAQNSTTGGASSGARTPLSASVHLAVTCPAIDRAVPSDRWRTGDNMAGRELPPRRASTCVKCVKLAVIRAKIQHPSSGHRRRRLNSDSDIERPPLLSSGAGY